ncbi:hypothetical protein TL16_g01308 [Triparma laevis f. inornata]|uniref:Uncharacterized protein n=1 Tax=Triparma laevis f. inornata TaxID=1714386 RepID=A0A9W6ZMT0_9STRA|nr:hypothetical protein TL16_g01308 [Triparma laevis f. inornata]
MDLFGLGEGQSYHAAPPSATSTSQTPPWRKRRQHLPEHLKLAQFWRTDLLEAQTREEQLKVEMLRPRTSRQLLNIDIYSAHGLYKNCQVRTIEGLAHLMKTQTRLRGQEYCLNMLTEALNSEKLAQKLLKTMDCLIKSGRIQGATRQWDDIHPYTRIGTFVPNELANQSGSSALVQNENRAIIAKLRQQQDDELHHRRTNGKPLASTFLSQSNTTDSIKHRPSRRTSNYSKSHPHLSRTLTRQLSNVGPGDDYEGDFFSESRRVSAGGKISNNADEDETNSKEDPLDDLLFEESESSEEEDENSEYAIAQKDAIMFDFDEVGMKAAASYRRSCLKHRTRPHNIVLERMSRDGIDVVNLSNMQLLTTNLRPVAEMITNMNHLHVLDMSNNNLKEEGGNVLAEAMSRNLRRLITLNLSNNDFKNSGLALAQSLRGMHAIQAVNLSRNGFEDDVLKSVAACLTNKSKSLSLDLSYNKFTCESVKHLSLARFTSLNLSWNLVGPAGAIHFAKELRNSSARNETLDLSYNRIGDEGCAALVMCAMTSEKISYINVRSNGITHVACHLLTLALPYFRSIVKFDISENVLTRGVVNELLRALNNHHNRHHTNAGRELVFEAQKTYRKLEGLPEEEEEEEIVSKRITSVMMESTSVTTPTPYVPDLFQFSYVLDLSFGVQHLLAEVLRHRVLESEVEVISGFVDGKHFVARNKLPWNGLFTLHLNAREVQKKAEKGPVHHGHLQLKLDLSNPTQKKVAIAHLIAHHENKMTIDPKNMSNSKKYGTAPTSSEEVNYTTKNIKYNNRRNTIVNKPWLNMIDTGFMSYDLHESNLHLHGLVKLDLGGGGRNEILNVLERVLGESSELEYVGRSKLNDEFFHYAEIFVRPSADPNGGGGKGAKVPMTPLDPEINLPSVGKIELEIYPNNPRCVYAESVELDLTNLQHRNLANIYAFRNRYCVGEGMMNPMVNGFRVEGMLEPDFTFPEDGTLTFVNIVTRPKRGMVKARFTGQTTFRLDLNDVQDYKLATAMRTMCLGFNSSCTSVITNCMYEGEAVLFGQIVDETWSLPTAGRLSFSFVPCVGVGKETGGGVVDSVCEYVKGLSDDILRVDFLRGTVAVKGGELL